MYQGLVWVGLRDGREYRGGFAGWPLRQWMMNFQRFFLFLQIGSLVPFCTANAAVTGKVLNLTDIFLFEPIHNHAFTELLAVFDFRINLSQIFH